jgi:hypothetical protein
MARAPATVKVKWAAPTNCEVWFTGGAVAMVGEGDVLKLGQSKTLKKGEEVRSTACTIEWEEIQLR